VFEVKSDTLAAHLMRYWWVNQNQTYRQEQEGGYLWSPKSNANGGRNPFYETMREVAPGDIVFSFVDTRIAAIGVAISYCWESPKPTEFGATGDYWSDVGWKVRVDFALLKNRIRPADHIEVLRPMLPARYSPLQSSGRGNQGVYLTEVSRVFAEVLAGLIGAEAQLLTGPNVVELPMQTGDDLDEWEQRIERQIEANLSIPTTEKESIIRARRGQGLFKERVMEIEERCRITGVTDAVHLIGSHIIPWRDSTDQERLDGENGLLLTPSVDHLFDRGFIGFEGNGVLVISPVAHRPSLERMGIPTNHQINVGSFTAKQKHFLEYHRDKVLLKAVRSGD
jgi:putative restriction endonuclease